MVGFVDDDEIEAAAGDVRSMIAAARERERGDQRNVTRLFAYGQTEQRGAVVHPAGHVRCVVSCNEIKGEIELE